MDIRLKRHEWKINKFEVDGRISSKNRHDYAHLRYDLYSEVRSFTNCRSRPDCPTYRRQNAVEEASAVSDYNSDGISGIDFDSQGIFLAAGTKAGCLTILNFQELYCSVYGPNSGLYDERRCRLHICEDWSLDVVKWDRTNRNQMLARLNVNKNSGISDIPFSSMGTSSLLASGMNGKVYAWDSRTGYLPTLIFKRYPHDGRESITSMETDVEERIIFAATNLGNIIEFDIRGGGRSGRKVFAVPNCNQGVDLVDFSPRKDREKLVIGAKAKFIRTSNHALSCVVHPNIDNIMAGSQGVYWQPVQTQGV